jgi:hypothetical protein
MILRAWHGSALSPHALGSAPGPCGSSDGVPPEAILSSCQACQTASTLATWPRGDRPDLSPRWGSVDPCIASCKFRTHTRAKGHRQKKPSFGPRPLRRGQQAVVAGTLRRSASVHGNHGKQMNGLRGRQRTQHVAAGPWATQWLPKDATRGLGNRRGVHPVIAYFWLCRGTGIPLPNVHGWRRLATIDQPPCSGELLHSCSSEQLQDMACTTDMAPEQEDPLPSSLHSCAFGQKAPGRSLASLEFRGHPSRLPKYAKSR